MRYAMALVLCFGACESASPTSSDIPTGSLSDVAGYRGVVVDLVDWECEYNEASCQVMDCDNNTAPRVGEPVVYVNDAIGTSPQPGDKVVVRFPVQDDECNLSCGSTSFSYISDRESMDSTESSCSNLPCSGDVELQLGNWTESGGQGEWSTQGTYTVSVRMSDGCGDESDRQELTVAVE